MTGTLLRQSQAVNKSHMRPRAWEKALASVTRKLTPNSPALASLQLSSKRQAPCYPGFKHSAVSCSARGLRTWLLGALVGWS